MKKWPPLFSLSNVIILSLNIFKSHKNMENATRTHRRERYYHSCIYFQMCFILLKNGQVVLKGPRKNLSWKDCDCWPPNPSNEKFSSPWKPGDHFLFMGRHNKNHLITAGLRTSEIQTFSQQFSKKKKKKLKFWKLHDSTVRLSKLALKIQFFNFPFRFFFYCLIELKSQLKLINIF